MFMKKRGREYFLRFKVIIMFLRKVSSMLPYSVRNALLSMFRNKNGYIGLVLRYVLFASMARKCGDNVTIQTGCYFFNIDKIEIGCNVAFNQMCFIQGAGGLVIGNGVGFAHGVTIETESHQYENLNIDIADQGLLLKPVYIEDDVWVGAKATILYGNRIKRGAIIGANAVVTKDVEEYAIVAGVPARVIKYRYYDGTCNR